MSKQNHIEDRIPTFAEIHKMYEKIAKMQEENARQQEKTDRQMKETDRIVQETSRQMQKNDRKFKAIQQEIGGIANSNGDFAEEYFENVFEADGLYFGGEHFDTMARNIKVNDPSINKKDEFDLVLYNQKNIAIIETKYKTRESNIEDVINKADSFRFWFPRYKKHNVYLGLADLTFDENTVRKAQKNGIAVIRQRGGKTIVNDQNLKVY